MVANAKVPAPKVRCLTVIAARGGRTAIKSFCRSKSSYPRLSELPLRFPLQSNRMPDGQLATLLSAAFSVLHTDDSGSDGAEFYSL